MDNSVKQKLMFSMINNDIKNGNSSFSTDSVKLLKTKIEKLKKIKQEFKENSDQVVTDYHNANENELGDFITNSNRFISVSDKMLEIVENEFIKFKILEKIFRRKSEKPIFNETVSVFDTLKTEPVMQRIEINPFPNEGMEENHHHAFANPKSFSDHTKVRSSIIKYRKESRESSRLEENQLKEMNSFRSNKFDEKQLKLHKNVARLIEENQVFLLYPLEQEHHHRTILPCLLDPKLKINFWTLLKENIGKDLSKISMPVYTKEPISLVQKLAEFAQYVRLIKEANRELDQFIRIAKIAGYFMLGIGENKYRLKSTFNSLLGETYEIVENDFRLVIEAVSTHPQVQAFYCESDDFILSGTITLKTHFSVFSLEFESVGNLEVYLKKTKESFLIKKPPISVHNYIIGELYIWPKNKLVVTNLITGDVATVIFKPKAWSSKNNYQVTGEIVDSQKNVVYNFVGKWDSHLSIVDVTSKTETIR